MLGWVRDVRVPISDRGEERKGESDAQCRPVSVVSHEAFLHRGALAPISSAPPPCRVLTPWTPEQEEMVIVRRFGIDPSVHLDLADAWPPFTQLASLLLLSAVCALLAVTLMQSVARPEPLWGQAWKRRSGGRRGGIHRLLVMYLLNVYVCEDMHVSGEMVVRMRHDRMLRRVGNRCARWGRGGGRMRKCMLTMLFDCGAALFPHAT